MKKIFFVFTATILVLVSNAQPLGISYDDFDAKLNNIGKLHNLQLSNVVNNFSITSLGMTLEDGVKQISDFNKACFLNNEVAYFGKKLSLGITNQEFEITKNYVKSTEFKNDLLSVDKPASLSKCLSDVSLFKDVDATNKGIMASLSDAIKQHIEGQLTNSAFESRLGEIGNTWILANDGNINAKGSQLTGNIIAIGLKSCEWWRQNIDAMYADGDNIGTNGGHGPYSEIEDERFNLYVAPLALDAAGALVSSVISTGIQYINNGSVSWTQVGTSAVAGAVTGSTGAVGKIAKWISSWF